MIRIGAVFLCEAATVRENLLHVLGGGISLLGRPSFPAPMDATLAMLLYGQIPTGESREYTIRGSLRSVDSGEITDMFVLTGSLQIHLPGEHSSPVVVPLAQAGIPHSGSFELLVVLDDSEPMVVPFAAIELAASAVEVTSAE